MSHVYRHVPERHIGARRGKKPQCDQTFSLREVLVGARGISSGSDARISKGSGAGENRGKTLTHDYVAFEWVGPLGFDPDGRLSLRRSLPLLPKAVAANSGVVAFVQNRSSAEVLQALMLPACS